MYDGRTASSAGLGFCQPPEISCFLTTVPNSLPSRDADLQFTDKLGMQSPPYLLKLLLNASVGDKADAAPRQAFP
jgi:hypothetical protein